MRVPTFFFCISYTAALELIWRPTISGKSSNADEKATIIHQQEGSSTPASILVAELPVDHQLYHLIEERGSEGITQTVRFIVIFICATSTVQHVCAGGVSFIRTRTEILQ